MILLAAAAVAALGPASAEVTAAATAYIETTLHLTRYKAASADLDADGAPEVLVYANAPEKCGSGGCDLYILTPAAGGYRVVTEVSVTRPPIRILPTSSHGWQDLGVFVVGGGSLPGHEARLRFDGKTYPKNPTVPPASPLAGAEGRVVIE